jgi:hypothetical protein
VNWGKIVMTRHNSNGVAGSAMLVTVMVALASTTAAYDPSDPRTQGDGTRSDVSAPILEAVGKTNSPGTIRAPQILGIIASHGPVPLHCGTDSCHADLSTFCLQQRRDNPAPGQSYVPVPGADMVLSGEDAMGQMVRLAAAPYLVFTADRGFTAVEVAIPPRALAGLKLRHLAIEIGEKVSLVPEATANGQPTAGDIAIATGALRDIGASFFDQTGRSGDAIRLANQMINALPERGHAPDTDSRVLEAAIASEAGRNSSNEGIALARTMYVACQDKVDVMSYYDTMRSCLEAAHDQLVAGTNVDFWNALVSY